MGDSKPQLSYHTSTLLAHNLGCAHSTTYVSYTGTIASGIGMRCMLALDKSSS